MVGAATSHRAAAVVRVLHEMYGPIADADMFVVVVLVVTAPPPGCISAAKVPDTFE